MVSIAAILFIVVLVALAIWASRTDDSQGNGDNRDAALRYGGPGA